MVVLAVAVVAALALVASAVEKKNIAEIKNRRIFGIFVKTCYNNRRKIL